VAFVLIIMAGMYITIFNDEKPTKIYANNNTDQNNSGDNFYIENTTNTSANTTNTSANTTNTSANTTNTSANTTIFENTEKVITVTNKVSSFEKLKPTSDAQLNVGETYIYHLYDKPFSGSVIPITCDPVELDVVIHVDNIEKINGLNYYILRSDRHELYPLCYETKDDGSVKQIYFGKPKKLGDRDQPKKYEGCVLGVNKDDPSNMSHIPLGENNAMCSTSANLRENWMLYLKEETTFIQEANVNLGDRNIIDRLDYIVEGFEKINKIECFKIKIIRVSGPDREHLEKHSEEVYYVDKEKRITVRYELYRFYHGGRILMRWSELKEIKKPYK